MLCVFLFKSVLQFSVERRGEVSTARPPATKSPFLLMTNQNTASPALHCHNQPPDSGSVHELQWQQLWLSLHRSHRHTCCVRFYRKNRTRLDLLSIPQSGGKKCPNFVQSILRFFVRPLSILLFFFFSCSLFLRIAGVAQAIMLWHMLLFGDAFGPAYAIFWCFCIQLCSFWGGSNFKQCFQQAITLLYGRFRRSQQCCVQRMCVQQCCVQRTCISYASDLACIKHNRVVKAAGRAFMRFVAHLMLLCLLCCALCLFFAEHCLFSDMLFHVMFMPK